MRTTTPSMPPEMSLRHYSWREVLSRFAPLVRPHRWRCLLAAVLVAAVGLAVAVVPLFPKYIIWFSSTSRRISWACSSASASACT